MVSKLWKRVVRVVCVAAMLSVYLPVTVQPAFAAAGYTGGADQRPPAYILNDHTVYAVHVSGTGLPVSKVLNISAKLSDTGVAGGFTNAPGFTWNGTSGRWVQSREAATSNGTLTSNSSGAISGWIFFKCGDENFTGFAAGNGHGANQAYLTVQIQDGLGSSYNPSVKPIVTVLNAATQAAWLHNGVSTGAAAGDRADAVSLDASTTYASQKAEANGVDDNDDAIIDNEDYGPAGATGDFLLGVPSATAVNVNLASSAWAPGQGITAGVADTNIAVGAADQTPPSAPSALVATSHNSSVSLSWSAVTDNGGSGLAGYQVFRSTGTTYAVQGTGDPTLTSALPVLIGSAGPSETTYTDTTVVNGKTYYYFVRAIDGATNVSARSNVQSAVPAPPELIPPTTAIAGVTDGGNYPSPARFSLTATDNVGGSGVASTYYTVDGVQSTYTAPVSVAAAGSHTVVYWSVDNAGNEETHHSLTFNVSAGPPVTTISGVVAGWSKTAETFSLVATGDGGAITTHYALNGGADNVYGAPVPVSAQGTTTVSYWSADSLNQTESTKAATVRIDGNAPVTSLSGLTEGAIYANSVVFSLSASDAVSGVQQVNYLVDNPGGSGALHPSGPVTLSGLSVGSHTVTYWSKDNASNTEARHTLTFDVTAGAPVTTISGVTPGWSQTAETFSLAATGDGGSITTHYTLNGGADTTYGGPVDVSAQGTTTVSYWSVDALNQTESPKTATIRIDGTAPTSSIFGVVDGGLYTDPATFTLSADDGVSGVSAIHYVLDSSLATQTYSSAVQVPGPGAHIVTYWAVDNAGNEEALHSLTFTVSAGAPVTTIFGVTPGWSKTAETLSLVATGDGVPITTHYALNGGADTTYEVPVTVSAQGTTTVSYWSVDALTQAEEPKTASVLIDSSLPTLTVPDGGVSSVPVTITASATDDISGIEWVRYRVDGGAWTTGTAAAISTPGTRTIDFQASDRAGNIATASTHAVIMAPTSLTAQGTSSLTYGASANVSGVLACVGADTHGAGVRLEYLSGNSWTAYPGAASVTTTGGAYSIRFKPDHNVKVRVAFLGAGVLLPTVSGTLSVSVRAILTLGTVANQRSDRPFIAIVTLAPPHAATVVFTVYRKYGSKFLPYRIYSVRGTSKFLAAIQLKAGIYHLQASHSDAGHVLSVSSVRYFTVR